jgi:predicted amidohydrolase
VEPSGRRRRETVRPEREDAMLAGLRALARDTGAWVLIGSLAIDISQETEGESRLANRSFLVDARGEIVARYDKIHMFDVDLAGGESYRESNAYRPGENTVVAETPWGRLGMTVCYDLRFPHLYRALAQAGADFLAVPSVFTVPTGKAHWHTLLRARAIENGSFMFAPAQWCEHAKGRRSYGHSLIVDPWGEVLADGGEAVGVVSARIDPARVAEVRRMVPSLQHDRPFTKPELVPRPLAAD